MTLMLFVSLMTLKIKTFVSQNVMLRAYIFAALRAHEKMQSAPFKQRRREPPSGPFRRAAPAQGPEGPFGA